MTTWAKVERTLARAGIGSTVHTSVGGEWKVMRGRAAHVKSAIDFDEMADLLTDLARPVESV